MGHNGPKPRRVPPEPAFETSNGLTWVFVSNGYRAFKLKSHGIVQMPMYIPLGSGQYGRVFEVQPVEGSEVSAAVGIGRQFAAKLLFLPDFEAEGITADVIRETNFYNEFSMSEYANNEFPNFPSFFGCRSCLELSPEFAEGYLGGVRHCGVLIVEKCRSDFGQYIKRLWAEKRMTISALKFYVWQLLNGVAKLHSQNVVHRDLKPENLLVDTAKVQDGDYLYEEGVSIVKIADFGMGRKVRWELSQQCAGSIAPVSLAYEKTADVENNSSHHGANNRGGRATIPPGFRINETGCMRQTGHVITLPYRPPDLLVADPKRYSSAKSLVADYGLWCDMWSLGVIILEMCLPQHAVRPPYRWQYAFVTHDARKATYQMEVMILENIFKIIGRPCAADLELMTRGAGWQRGILTKFLSSFPQLDMNVKKLSINDFILERGGLQLDELGLDLIARLLQVSPTKRLAAECALAHPWFHDLPYQQMNRLGLISHLAELASPNVRGALPNSLRLCIAWWESTGRSVAHTQFAMHGMLHQMLLRQEQEHLKTQQQYICGQLRRVCSRDGRIAVEQGTPQKAHPKKAKTGSEKDSTSPASDQRQKSSLTRIQSVEAQRAGARRDPATTGNSFDSCMQGPHSGGFPFEKPSGSFHGSQHIVHALHQQQQRTIHPTGVESDDEVIRSPLRRRSHPLKAACSSTSTLPLPLYSTYGSRGAQSAVGHGKSSRCRSNDNSTLQVGPGTAKATKQELNQDAKEQENVTSDVNFVQEEDRRTKERDCEGDPSQLPHTGKLVRDAKRLRPSHDQQCTARQNLPKNF
ncbi:CMGC kinase [Toxoplasma gondii TgCatPRC2]|uniref:Cyclin-dependent kinase 2 homolog n=3 Tax=Toxoplasma gondii TaxID=5811 RepID=A0A151HD83_TOXGO|nr:CMGC kinase [Toxoplasma gondii ME49]EPT31695.1 CMGC kinase [Toxoplasma gondii ME49]KYF42023.1 CMGC kinase [Toxoplasma gondii ARI]KYK67322.1 CMGC kinase [Toxoplasma gondii TgCatPRC2]|eukprot:XP_018638120.1 CMGC kinase [Toxoplasma gondii ME49]